MALSDIPTCVEAGLPVEEYRMPRTVWTNGKVADEAVAYHADVLAKVRETPKWKDWLARTSQTDRFVTGEDFQKMVAQESATARQLFERTGWLVSN